MGHQHRKENAANAYKSINELQHLKILRFILEIIHCSNGTTDLAKNIPRVYQARNFMR